MVPFLYTHTLSYPPTFFPQLRDTAMPPKRTNATWMKNHPLEGDNVVTGFYNFLSKKNSKTMKPCHNIIVPDTIVFEHNFPRGWYTTDIKAREIMRRQGRDLDASTIEKGFTANVSDSCPIVATYLCMQEEDLGNGETETKTLVEVFNKDTIGEFLARKTKHKGILQKFIHPKGYNNSVLEAVWSPRICMVQRRTNKYPVSDKKRAEGDPFSTVVTYEGPNYLSEQGSVSGNIAENAKRLCGHIVQHFYYTEQKFITRMVLYFKVDAKDRLWFLWCGSLRVADRGANSEMAVSLTTNFCEPTGAGSCDEDRMLWEADQAHLRVTNDEMFFETYMKNVQLDYTDGRPGSAAGHGSSAAAERGADGNAPGAWARDGAEFSGRLSPRGARSSYDWSLTPPIVQDTIERLVREREELCAVFEDLFYKARTHNCVAPRAPPFVLEVPARARDVLTESGVVDLMRCMRLPSVPGPRMSADKVLDQSSGEVSMYPSDEAHSQADVMRAAPAEANGDPAAASATPAMRYTVDPVALKTPITKLSDEAREWLDEFFDAKEARLQSAVERLGHDTDALLAEISFM